MVGGMRSPSSRRAGLSHPAWLEPSRIVLRIFLIAGLVLATVGVSIFTYSEAYPPSHNWNKKDSALGALPLSQLGFWFIIAGLGIVSVSVAISQILSCSLSHRSLNHPSVAVTTGTGTGFDNIDEEHGPDEAETSSLIGSNKVNYGSTVFNPSPFSASSLVRAPSTASPPNRL